MAANKNSLIWIREGALLGWRAVAVISALYLASLVMVPTHAWAEGALEADLAQCWSCHGRDGRSNDSTMPVIWGQTADYIMKQLSDYRDGGRENQIMSSMAESIPRSKLAEAAKIISLKPWPQLDAPVSKALLPDLAQACTACHGADLMGAVTDAGPAPRLAGQNERYLAEQMQAFATGLRANQDIMTSMMRAIDAAQREVLAHQIANYAP